MRLGFTKMSGAGNDFIFLGPECAGLKADLASLARRLCPRKVAVGADGLVLVEKTDGGIFMHYFNGDGSQASFCGNGARCLVRYCLEKRIAAGTVSFKSKSGEHSGDAVAGEIRVSMKAPTLIRETALRMDGGRSGRTQYDVRLIDAGVPHAVILVPDVGAIDVESLGSLVRHHPEFAPEGANADFVEVGRGEPYRLRTYERGVEAETLACGSGCVAAALALRQSGLAGERVRLGVASGDVLAVEFAGQVYLIGPAAIVYEGEVEIKELDHV